MIYTISTCAEWVTRNSQDPIAGSARLTACPSKSSPRTAAEELVAAARVELPILHEARQGHSSPLDGALTRYREAVSE